MTMIAWVQLPLFPGLHCTANAYFTFKPNRRAHTARGSANNLGCTTATNMGSCKERCPHDNAQRVSDHSFSTGTGDNGRLTLVNFRRRRQPSVATQYTMAHTLSS